MIMCEELSGNQDIRDRGSGNLGIRGSGNLGIRRSGNLGIRRSGIFNFRITGFPDIRIPCPRLPDIRITLIILSIWLALVGFAFATSQAGMDIAVLGAGVGARPLGMGGAFTSIADNADAPYWNPAGLANIKNQEINTMQTRLSSDSDHYYISYIYPLKRGAIGISWIQVALGTITRTTTTDAFNEVITTGIFSYFSNAYMLSYGLPITPNISFGLTAKYLTSDMFPIAGGQAYGYSVTPGFLIRFGEENVGTGLVPVRTATRAVPTLLTVGFKIDELFNEQKWGTGTAEKAIPKARLGISVKEPRGLLAGSLFAVDLAQTLSKSYAMEISLGYEWVKDALSIRAGYANSAISAGAGFVSGITRIDYAYVQQTSLSRENVHRVSLSGKW